MPPLQLAGGGLAALAAVGLAWWARQPAPSPFGPKPDPSKYVWVPAWDRDFPNVPAERTPLAAREWGPPRDVTAEELRAYDRDGFVVLPHAVDPGSLDTLLEAARSTCVHQLKAFGECQVMHSRWLGDVPRDFLFFGPLGRLAQAFVRGRGVRVWDDGYFALRRDAYHDPQSSGFLTYNPHMETRGGHVGMLGGLHSNTSGVMFWVALHDIYGAEGGSVDIWPGWHRHPCRHQTGTFIRPTVPHAQTINRSIAKNVDCSLAPDKQWGQAKTSPSFKKGDVMAFHPFLLHASKRMLRDGQRYSYFARFVDSDATLCMMMCGKRLPCCQDGLRSGDKIQHACYPQVYPETLPHEYDAYFSTQPKPLLDREMADRKPHPVHRWEEREMVRECAPAEIMLVD